MVKKITITASLLVVFLLNAAILINAALTPQELNPVIRSRRQLSQHLPNESDARFGVQKEVTAAPSGTNNGNCITHEFCMKKKIVCSKECNSRIPVNGDVDPNHFPGQCKITCKFPPAK